MQYSKTSLNQQIMVLALLNGLFTEVVGLSSFVLLLFYVLATSKGISGRRIRKLEYHYNGILWGGGESFEDPNKAISIREWSICGGGRLDLARFIL